MKAALAVWQVADNGHHDISLMFLTFRTWTAVIPTQSTLHQYYTNHPYTLLSSLFRVDIRLINPLPLFTSSHQISHVHILCSTTFAATDMPNNRRGPSGPQPREVLVSKKLSWLLRHGAEKEGLVLGKGGYVNLGDVVGLMLDMCVVSVQEERG